MKKQKKYTKRVTPNKNDAIRIQTYLDSNNPVIGCGTDEVIDLYVVKFPNRFEADIKVVNSESGAYIDAVLFDDNNCEVAVCEPTYSFLGDYHWWVDGVEYIATVELHNG